MNSRALQCGASDHDAAAADADLPGILCVLHLQQHNTAVQQVCLLWDLQLCKCAVYEFCWCNAFKHSWELLL